MMAKNWGGVGNLQCTYTFFFFLSGEQEEGKGCNGKATNAVEKEVAKKEDDR